MPFLQLPPRVAAQSKPYKVCYAASWSPKEHGFEFAWMWDNQMNIERNVFTVSVE